MLAANLLYTVQSSLEYENVKENLPEMIKVILEDELNTTDFIDDSELQEAQKYCLNNSYFVQDSNFSDFGSALNISCSSINQGEEAITQEILNEIIEQVYYKDYDCKFTQCLEEGQNVFYLVSQDFQGYLLSKVYLAFFIVITLFILIFLLAESKANAFIISGVLIIISALPFLKAETLFSSMGSEIFQFVSLMFVASTAVFIKVFIIGLVVLIIGIILKFFNIGFKISEFFNNLRKDKKIDESVSKEEVKEIVKSEVSKAKKETKKAKK